MRNFASHVIMRSEHQREKNTSLRSFTPFYYDLDFVNTIADGGPRTEIKMHRRETVMSRMLINTTFNASALKNRCSFNDSGP